MQNKFVYQKDFGKNLFMRKQNNFGKFLSIKKFCYLTFFELFFNIQFQYFSTFFKRKKLKKKPKTCNK